jgi:DNA invertase Pin-like site-specific DNA recombinase
MISNHKPAIRCAIYTRKSSEEGLEQSFNSLDAQREACQSFIASQREEGWRLLPTRYDDGGYSGGSLERPAIKALLADVEAGKLDIIIVYKVDRLTRSLSDFAKIVETLDARRVSFVSVTQQFNTTTSMGRLTLNVLLSFAQFEREVTGERIRDKIAASKRKGMWMGGNVPLGYDLKERKLFINSQEASVVRKIFALYLKLGCVSLLKKKLDQDRIKSKVRVSIGGKRFGGVPYSRGALYKILKNRVYLGLISHRSEAHPGQHEAIIDRDLWNQVHTKLASDNQGRKNSLKVKGVSLLAGLICDSDGNRFTPSHTVKNGKRYRYYVSQKVIKNPGVALPKPTPTRIPAYDLEKLVLERLRSFLSNKRELVERFLVDNTNADSFRKINAAAQTLANRWSTQSVSEVRESLLKILRLVRINQDSVELEIDRGRLCEFLTGDKQKNGAIPVSAISDKLHLKTRATLKRCGLEMRLSFAPIEDPKKISQPNPALLKAIARAYKWNAELIAGKVRDQRDIAKQTGLDEVYVGKILKYALLAPHIIEAILNGRQPPFLTLAQLQKRLPMCWAQQRKQLQL